MEKEKKKREKEDNVERREIPGGEKMNRIVFFKRV